MARKPPERILWAVRLLEVRPNDRILEIGCGRGHAIGPICGLLETGHLTAIDSSRKMAEIASRSNIGHLAEGKADVLTLSIPGSGLSESAYDKIFLMNMNVFWMDPIEELAEISRLIKADGLFYIFHQPPPGCEVSEYAEAFERNLTKNSFEVLDVCHSGPEELNSVCVVSRPLTRR